MSFDEVTPEAPGLDDTMISSLIPAVSKAHRKVAGALLAQLGLAAGQQFVLMLLWKRSPQSQADLTRQLMIEPPTAAKMLSRLEAAGFIARQRSEADRRIVLVSVTDAGAGLEQPVTAIWQQLETQTTSALTSAEQDQLRTLLTKVLGSVSPDSAV